MTTLTAFSEAFVTLEQHEQCIQVGTCRLQKMYDAKHKRIMVCIHDKAVMTALSRSLVQLGAKPLLGAPPSGAMEDMLQRALRETYGK